MTKMVSQEADHCASSTYQVSCRPRTGSVCISSDAIIWGALQNDNEWMCPLILCINNREAYMILNIRSHTLGVTLFSMTLRDLNLVLLMNWWLLGISLRRSLQKLSWKISCMQFGILIYPFTWLVDQAPCRYCIPMDSPRPIPPAELEFFNKGTGRGKS